MPEDFILQQAANCGKTKWLQQLLLKRLPELNFPSTNYQDWLEQMLEKMAERGLTEPSQQKNYLTDIRNAIKTLDPNHLALDLVKFDKETWAEINSQDTERIAQRTTKFISNPDAIVQRATVLLNSYQWSEIAAGLAVVTGRRCTEVIKTAQFKYKSKYSLIFTGSLKRRNEPVECVFEIPTLCEAQLVIKSIALLREQLGQEIQSLSKREVSSRYSRAVAHKCDRYFSELVPPRDDKDNLYTHLFRAVYATIASYWYCPASVPEMEFRAAIQGHYQILDEQNPKLRRSLAAGRNYFDYKISDSAGNIDGRLGIKLNLPDVQAIEQFAHLSSPSVINSQPNKNPTMTQASSSTTNTVIPSFLLSRLKVISARLGLSTSDTIQALFNWTEVSLSLAESLEIEELNPHVLFEAVEQLKENQTYSAHNSPNGHLTSIEQPDTQYPSQLTSLENPMFDPENIKNLCASVKLLSESVLHQQNLLLSNTSTSVAKFKFPSTQQTSANKDKITSSLITSVSPTVIENNSGNQTESTEPVNKAKRSRSQEAEAEVNRGINAIMAFNNQDDISHKDKWYIGIGSLRKLVNRGDTVIKRVLKSRQDEVERHNSSHQLESRHNCRGYDAPSIDKVITL